MIYGIILAAGSGSRMKTKDKKQFIKINNKPVLYYSIDKFLKVKKINRLIMVINKNDFDNSIFKSLLKIYNKDISSGKINFVFGGKERYDSVYNALSFIDEYMDIKSNDKVLIHDSARPNVDINDINNLIKSLNKYKAVTLGYKLSDSIKLIRKSNNSLKQVIKSIDRNSHYLISTPQGFDFKTIYNCYNKFVKSKKKLNITDDMQIIEYFSNEKGYILDSNKLNFKITTKDDLNMIKYII